MQLENLARQYARMQHAAVDLAQANSVKLRQHIAQTLKRCLPARIVTDSLTEKCHLAVSDMHSLHDPMHMGAIHAFAGQFLLSAKDCSDPLLQKLHLSAVQLLSPDHAATRDELRLVTLSALYNPKLLHSDEAHAFVRHRLGLRDGRPRSCEEIAFSMHKPLVYIHELESAVLTTLSSHYTGGHHA